MAYRFLSTADARTIPIIPIETAVFAAWLKKQPAAIKRWVESAGFTAQAGEVSLVAGKDGALSSVLLGVEDHQGLWAYAALPESLPEGRYRIDAVLEKEGATNAAIGWALGCYRFERYKSKKKTAKWPGLVWPRNCDKGAVRRTVDAIGLVRDLINTPAEDMGPAELATAARRLARTHKAKARVIVGDALLKQNYPTIHAVGRASVNAPRLIDLTWGRRDAPKVTLVGKGVCFDTGGLDLKAASGMLRMKKDMGGAAHVLGLGHMIMDAGLDVRLRVMIGAVENSVAGNAYRPADVIKTRKGITVEVGNTDAEGRLVMCDALAEADDENPALMADFATLTGAARVAVGTELSALFCNDDTLANDLSRAGEKVGDPVWRLPLWRPYRRLLDSKVADINNVSEGGMGGAITAALYLEEFVSRSTPWAHFDIMGWNTGPRPGRPVGGEAMGMRALYGAIEQRFGKKRGRK
ncbi:MAG: leucyl aminopeptidase family protein [Rhodospirillaceae bacterium]|nr:leucyl aminopeptidase family protein [Rhodospirillaceae bacterium]MBT5455935.1 leucyl aminopeptidase family protein [Rhodospirillaceae bacterium]